ncbi:hypothetical protein DERF_002904, partial [Dermatophagoides farinae]
STFGSTFLFKAKKLDSLLAVLTSKHNDEGLNEFSFIGFDHGCWYRQDRTLRDQSLIVKYTQLTLIQKMHSRYI